MPYMLVAPSLMVAEVLVDLTGIGRIEEKPQARAQERGKVTQTVQRNQQPTGSRLHLGHTHCARIEASPPVNQYRVHSEV